MARFFTQKPILRPRPPDPVYGERVPPGQTVTAKFPVLTHGPTPEVDLETWEFRLWGLVGLEARLDWEGLLALPQTEVTADFHCVTTWSRMDNRWTGVRVRDLLEATGARPLEGARHVLQHACGGYTTNTPLADLLEGEALLAHSHDGEPLSPEHGGPLRMVIPHLYAWKGAKWITGLEFLADDRLGFWETHGYHARGDPWKEERFA